MKPVEAVTTSVTDTIFSRRSIRSYAPDRVDDATVRRLLDAAVQAPTAMHAEPWLFVIVQDRAALKRYSDLAKTTLIKEAHVFRDLHDPMFALKNGGFLKALASPDFNVFYNAGTLILICGRPSNPFVSADCWLAAQNLMLEATALGLGTCCVGSALSAMNAPEVKQDLGIPTDVQTIAAIIVGVPAERAVAPARKPPAILTWKRAPDRSRD